jgi:hypothetical protein
VLALFLGLWFGIPMLRRRHDRPTRNSNETRAA